MVFQTNIMGGFDPTSSELCDTTYIRTVQTSPLEQALRIRYAVITVRTSLPHKSPSNASCLQTCQFRANNWLTTYTYINLKDASVSDLIESEDLWRWLIIVSKSRTMSDSVFLLCPAPMKPPIKLLPFVDFHFHIAIVNNALLHEFHFKSNW